MAQPSDDLEGRLVRLEQQSERLAFLMERSARQEDVPAAAAPATPATPRTGRHWDAYAALIAAFIGLVAVVVAGYTAYLERQQLRAQVWPRLELSYYNAGDVRFAVANRGSGPARVTAMRVTVAGKPIKFWGEAGNAVGVERLMTGDLTGRVLSAEQEALLAEPPSDEPSRAKFQELFPGGKQPVEITVCYCSVLDECWVTVSGEPPDDEPSDCPIPVDERFDL